MGWQGLSLMRLRSGKVPRVLGSVLGKERKAQKLIKVLTRQMDSGRGEGKTSVRGLRAGLEVSPKAMMDADDDTGQGQGTRVDGESA